MVVAGPEPDPSAPPAILLEDICREYVSGDNVVQALRSVSLSIAHGELVAIVGTSGSGKSTLMNILGCLDRPTSGRYSIAGNEVGGRSQAARALARNRLIGFVFQGYNLLPRLTALENAELPLQYRKVPRAERRARALAALETVGLGARTHHRPNEMSGGQQQRVAIARALVTNPPLVLADEPTGNLDTRTTYEVLAMFQTLNRQRGITIVLVTHEPEVAACASRVVTVRDGRIVSDVRNERPVDAARALAELPAPVHVAPSSLVRHSRAVISRPLRRAYLAMLLGAFLGGVAGFGYAVLGLGIDSVVVPTALGALLGEPLLTSLHAKRRGVPFTRDERVRIALVATAATAVCFGLLAWFWPQRVASSYAGLARRSVAAYFATTTALVLLVMTAGSLLRYLLLSLFGAATPHRWKAIAGVAVLVSTGLLATAVASKFGARGATAIGQPGPGR